eukprot:2791200-Karenia_brevis.AAC.1
MRHQGPLQASRLRNHNTPWPQWKGRISVVHPTWTIHQRPNLHESDSYLEEDERETPQLDMDMATDSLQD